MIYVERLTKIVQKLEPLPSPRERGRRTPLRNRLVIGAVIGLTSGWLCWYVMTKFGLGGGDFFWAMRAARDLLTGHDPYDYPFHSYAVSYPLTTAFFGLPFIFFQPEVGAGLFFGLSSGLLAFGVTRYGYQRLLIFMSYPYIAALTTAQWSPLLMVAAFFPLFMPFVLAKPHIGFSIFSNFLTRRGFWLTLFVGLLSLLVMPTWPLRWLSQVGDYQNFIPILILPGPLLLLAALNYRDRDARVLLLASVLPQRWFYDNFILWLIPKSRLELLLTTTLSWIVGIWRWYVMPQVIEQVGLMSVLFFYLPMLGVVLWRWQRRRKAAEFV